MEANRNVIVQLSEKLEKMAVAIAGDSKSAITWGEVPLPDCLREEVEKKRRKDGQRK